MKLSDLPRGMIDWSRLARAAQPGETGSVTARAYSLGDLQLRIVEYGAGYLADHWCDKGHILLVLAGELAIEHQDGVRYELKDGMSWHVADAAAAPHRVVSRHGATVFIVD